MSSTPQGFPRPLPEHPDLRHLKDQARDLLEAGKAESLAKAQFPIARLYGFASWSKLKTHVESLQTVGQLKQAIDSTDLERVKQMMTRDPALHHAPLGYGKNGPLTWVAECRAPREAPREARLAMARWMIENGSDGHQGGDGPLMRAALADMRIPMMQLLTAENADVNIFLCRHYPINPGDGLHVTPVSGGTLLHMAIEYDAIDVARWLINRGADVNVKAALDVDGFGGHTPLFHTAVTLAAPDDSAVRLLLERGANPDARATIRKQLRDMEIPRRR